MNPQLEHLIRLQQIDTKILDIRRAIEDLPGKIRETEAPLQQILEVFGSVKQRYSACEKKKREKELELEDIDQKISKLKSRTVEIKTNKEYQALLKEIESVEQVRSSIEDNILLVMDDIDIFGKRLKDEELNLNKNREEIETLKKHIENEKAVMEKELSSLQEMRSTITVSLEGEIYDQYIALIDIGRGHAVIEVKDEICQGCNMNIPPQLFVEIKKNEEIYNCPHCRRILFFKENVL